MNNLNITDLDTVRTGRSQNNTEYLQIALAVIFVMEILNVIIGLPVNCLAICSLYRMIRADIVVPIYIINLLIADLLQVIARLVSLVIILFTVTLMNIQSILIALAILISLMFCSLSASIGFMLCIALERYLVVAHPLWYRYRRNVRHTALVSVGVWVLAAILTAVLMPLLLILHLIKQIIIILSVLFLLPFPLLLFFFFGTWRAIASATSVRDAEKRRIVRMLALVLGTYTVLFLPFCIVSFIMNYTINVNIFFAAIITTEMISLSVLVDPVLYILLRPAVRNTLDSPSCCQRLFTLTNCWTPRAEQETEDTATVSTVTTV